MTVLATDTFTGTDGTSLNAYSGNWTPHVGAANTIVINTNSAAVNATGQYRYSAVQPGNDQYAQVTWTSAVSGAAYMGVMVRADTAGLYRYSIYNTTSAGVFSKYVNGTGTEFSSDYDTGGVAVNDVVYLRAYGTTITPLQNGNPFASFPAVTDSDIASGYTGLKTDGSSLSNRVDNFTIGDFGTYETKYPDAVLASTNLAGAVTDIDEDPDNSDANWMTASTATSATEIRVSFPTPTGNPVDFQNFRFLLRKTTGTPQPRISYELRQNNTLRKTFASNVEITSTSGQIIQADWAASDLVSVLDGSDVELKIVAIEGRDAAPGTLPAYNSSGTAYTSATLSGSHSVAVPAHSSGDLLLLVVFCKNTEADGKLASISTSGWSQIGGTGTMYGGSQIARIGGGWKIGNGSESTVSISASGGATADRILARVHRFTAINGFHYNPIQAIGSATTGSSTSLGMPTVAPPTTNCLACAMIGASSSTTMAAATGESNGNWTEPIAEQTGTNGACEIQLSDQSSGSTISGGTATLGTTGVWVGIGFAICPADLGTGTARNTVEIGAIKWDVAYIPGGGASTVPVKLSAYRRARE